MRRCWVTASTSRPTAAIRGHPVDAGLPNQQVMALAADPGDPNTVWAAVGHDSSATNGVYRPGGIYETTDGGGVLGLEQHRNPAERQQQRE